MRTSELSAPVVMGVVCFRLRESDDKANSAVVEEENQCLWKSVSDTDEIARTNVHSIG